MARTRVWEKTPDASLRPQVEPRLADHQSPHQISAEETVRVEAGDVERVENHDQYLGKIFDEKYRLERLLGQGGMGAVYLSTHLGTGRYVALKLITPYFGRMPRIFERDCPRAPGAYHSEVE